MNIIGLVGFAGSGKTTAAENMPGWERFSFAGALKNDLRGLLAGIGCDLNKREDKEKARPLLVAWGEVARSFHPNYWIDRLFKVLDLAYEKDTEAQIVIDDVRYLNEVMAILNRGGKVVGIHRMGHFGANETEIKSIGEIEKYLGNTAVNNGTPEELGAEVLRLCK